MSINETTGFSAVTKKEYDFETSSHTLLNTFQTTAIFLEKG